MSKRSPKTYNDTDQLLSLIINMGERVADSLSVMQCRQSLQAPIHGTTDGFKEAKLMFTKKLVNQHYAFT